MLGRQGRACAARVDLPLAGARVVLAGGVFSHPTTRLADATMAQLPGAVSGLTQSLRLRNLGPAPATAMRIGS